MSIIQQLALVSESQTVTTGEVMRVAAALQKQVTRDVLPIWQISATVDAFETLEDVPVGYWPMIVKDNIGHNAAGIHLDDDRQPFALITASNNNDTWSLTASHEALEMLIDPFGDRLVAGDSPIQQQGRVSFLVEICDPSEAADFAYSVNGVLVSDFYTPDYFDPVFAAGVRYSYTGALTKPRQVLRGGYLSWKNPQTSDWWQEIWFGGTKSKFRNLGPLSESAGSLRSQIDRITGAETAAAIGHGRKAASFAGLTAAIGRESSSSNAAMWHKKIDSIIAAASQPNHLLTAGRYKSFGAKRRKPKKA